MCPFHDPVAGSSRPAEPSLDEIFELFTRERRRFVLYYLDQRDEPVSVSEVKAKLREWEDREERTTVPDGDYDRLGIELAHQHIPRAAEAEFIEYDREAGTIEITDAPTEFRLLLRVSETIERPGEDDVLTLG